MSRWVWLGGLLLIGCSARGGVPAEDSGLDARDESAPDAPPDVVADTAADADAQPDAEVFDTGLDAPEDTAHDSAGDSPTDAAADTTEDGGSSGGFPSMTVGSTGNDEGSDLVVTRSGEIYLTGMFSGSVTFGDTTLTSAGGIDGVVAKVATDGSVLWAIRAGGTNSDWPFGIAIDSDENVYVAGYFDNSTDLGGGLLTGPDRNGFLASYTSEGAYRWSKAFVGPSGDTAGEIAIDSDDNVYVVGNYLTEISIAGAETLTSAGSLDGYLASFDSSGGFIDAISIGGTGVDLVLGVATGMSDHVFLTGYFEGTMSLGTEETETLGSYDVFVGSVNSDLSARWVQSFGGTGGDVGFSVATDSAGNVYATGYTDSQFSFHGATEPTYGYQIYLASYEDDGSVRWGQTFASSGGSDEGHAVTTDLDGNIHLVGYMYESIDFGIAEPTTKGFLDVIVASFDTEGDPLWAQNYGSENDDRGYGIASDGTTLYVIGFSGGELDADGTTLPAFGGTDILLLEAK